MFPKIHSPCPYRFASAPDDQRNFCTQCERSVHRLDGMSTTERVAFLANCGSKVCVAYTVHRKPASKSGLVLAAGVAASLLVGTASAQDVEAEAEELEYITVVGGTVSTDDGLEWVAQDAVEIPEVSVDTPELEFVAPPK